AHFDSWHASTGATDNAAGCAAMMEAMRILKQSGVRLRRTVRIGLWTGEEQGLLGSAQYVSAHFGSRATLTSTTTASTTAPNQAAADRPQGTAPANPPTASPAVAADQPAGGRGGGGRGALGPLQLKPAHAKLAGYFNIDNGTGAIRGVYLQGNDAVAPIFREWMEPFRSLGMAY